MTARGSDSFGHDQANRLKSAIVSGTTTNNTFDGDGKRATQKVGAGATVTYAYDTNRSLPVVLSDGTLKYVWGLGLLYAVAGSGNLQVFHPDGLGSTRALTDGAATLIDTYRTDAWGNPTATQGSSTQPFRFAGEQLDSDGLIYLRARFYESVSGRVLARDSLVGTFAAPVSLNRFSYALNSPVARADPSGLFSSRVLQPGLTASGMPVPGSPAPTATPAPPTAWVPASTWPAYPTSVPAYAQTPVASTGPAPAPTAVPCWPGPVPLPVPGSASSGVPCRSAQEQPESENAIVSILSLVSDMLDGAAVGGVVGLSVQRVAKRVLDIRNRQLSAKERRVSPQVDATAPGCMQSLVGWVVTWRSPA